MEEDLRAHLAADGVVAGLVADRIAWGGRPQGETFPCIVLWRITGARDYSQAGRNGFVESLVQIDCWADTWLAAKTVARAVVGALDGLTAAPFQRAFTESERDDAETDPVTGAPTAHRTLLEARVFHADAS